MSDELLLEATGLVKNYSAGRRGVVHAVNGVDLSLAKGRSLGVVGESGSGKSTLARLLVKLEDPTAGSLRIAGEDLSSLRGSRLQRWRRRVQMVFQDPTTSLNPRMTVEQIISEPWLVHRDLVPRERRKAELQTLLESVGLTEAQGQRRPHALSGGQRQRVAIARALAVRPDLIVCDEAVSSLDVSVQAQILNVLQDVRDATGVSFVFIAHDISVVRHFCDDVAVMYLGRVMESGRAVGVLSRPTHPYTAALVAAEPEPHFERQGRPQFVLGGETASPIDLPPGCAFHPRCWKAQDDCSIAVPPLSPAARRSLACYHPLDDTERASLIGEVQAS